MYALLISVALCAAATERVAVPEDAGWCHLSVILPANASRTTQAQWQVWLDRNSMGDDGKKAVHTHVYLENNSWYRAKLARAVPQVPAVVFQRPDGVLEKGLCSFGADMPELTGRLFHGRLKECLHRRRTCPQQTPTPAPPEDTGPTADQLRIAELEATIAELIDVIDKLQAVPEPEPDNTGMIVAGIVGYLFLLLVVGGACCITPVVKQLKSAAGF